MGHTYIDMNHRIFICILSLLLLSLGSRAQNKSTFGEIKSVNDAYFESLNNPYEKGSGFKQYERWKYFWEQRISDDDTIPSMSWRFYHNLAELRKMGMPTALDAPHGLGKTESSYGVWENLGSDSSPGGYEGTGRLMSIGFDPVDKNTFYVGAPSGGLWKTTDFGQTWEPKSDYLPQIGVGAIVVDPNNPNIIYLGSGDMDGRDHNSIGVLKSYDGGDTWNTTGLSFAPEDYQQISRMEMDPSDPHTLIVTAADGVFRTTDSAHTWDTVLTGSNWRDLSFSPLVPGLVIASRSSGGNSYIYRSVDHGQNWVLASTIIGAKRTNFSLSHQQPGKIMAVACNTYNALHGVFRSIDTGSTFVNIFDPNISAINLLAYDPNGANLSSGQGWYDLFIAVDPLDDDHITVGGINVWDSYNGGQYWNISTHWYGASGLPVIHADQHYSTYHPLDPSIHIVLNDGGIYYRDLDSSYTDFIDITNGLSINQIYKLAVARDSTDHVLTGLQDNGSKLLQKNGLWRSATGGDGGECAIEPFNQNYMYAEYVYGVVYRSNDKFDQDRVTISDNIPGPSTGAWITPFELFDNSPNEILIGYDEIFYSSNRGAAFSQISFFGNADPMRSLATTPAYSEVIFASDYDNIYYTYDKFSTNWLSIGGNNSKGLPLQDLRCTMLEISPTDAGRIVAVFGGYDAGQKVYQSLDSGNTWTNISAGLPNVPVLCVAMDQKPNNGIYVGCDVGVYYKNDLTGSFSPYFDSLAYAPVTKLVFNPIQGSVFACTYGRGVWKTNEVDSSDHLVIFPSGPVCENINLSIISSGISNSSSYTYTWYVNGQAQNTTGPKLTSSNLKTGDAIYCTATDGNQTYVSDTLNITILDNPTPNIFWNSGATSLVSSNSTGNQWYVNSQALQGEISPVLLVHSKNLYGDFQVKTMQKNGCISAFSNTISRYPDSFEEPDEDRWSRVYPSRVSDMITIEVRELESEAAARILDMQGKVLRSISLKVEKTSVSLKTMSAGIYIVSIQNGDLSSSQIIEKVD